MLFSHISTVPGEVTSISVQRDYVTSPLALFARLNKVNSLLLESAEIESKGELKSLLLVDSALRIECNAREVTLKAQSNNGAQLLDYLANKIFDCTCTRSESSLTLTYAPAPEGLEQTKKLVTSSPFSALRACLTTIKNNSNNPFALFLGGVFGYDMVANFESLIDVESGDNSCPDYVFYLAETLVVIDHQKQTTELIGNVFNGPDVHANCFEVGRQLESLDHLCGQLSSYAPPATGDLDVDVTVDISDEEFCDNVEALKERIKQGDIFQVVPSRTFSLPCPDPLGAYAKLKQQNPSPYMFYMQDESFSLFGASPESALKYCPKSNEVEVYPIAGTRARGKNPDGSINRDLDSRIELALRDDQKERAEHLMLVDLARNDVARISKPGTRYVKDLLSVDRYSQVMHLVSRVVGELKGELDALHAYQACMNMGTLVGAPKIKAAQLIRHYEQKRRGSYGGAVGYLTADGAMDTCIVIRSAFVKDQTAHVQAGAGVVYDSVPQAEADETRAKAQAVITAIRSGGQGNEQGGKQ